MDSIVTEFQSITGMDPNEIPLYVLTFIMIAFSIYLWKNEK